VHEAKLVRFLAKEIINRSLKSSPKKRKRDENSSLIEAQKEDLFLSKGVDENASSQTLKYQSVRNYKIELMNLYYYQVVKAFNYYLNSNDVALQSLMKAQRIT